MSAIKNPRSRWLKGKIRTTIDLVSGAWNRNLQRRERAPTERGYIDSFRETQVFKHGARIRGQR